MAAFSASISLIILFFFITCSSAARFSMKVTNPHNHNLAFASLLRNSLSKNLSFSIQLTHRDSPSSPLFNASQTPSDRFTNALRRSANRVKRFKEAAAFSPSSGAPQSLVTGGGDYHMSLSLGTPPVQMLAILDTRSDLLWTQCQPCALCYDQSTPFFNPKTSSTYQNVTCHSEACLSFRENANCESSSCHYRYTYVYESSTSGILATDTVTLGSTTGQPFSLEDTTFGCGTYNVGYFHGTGIVGFGQGPLSFPSQVKDLIDHKFSYCLTPSSSNHPSKLNFGSNSEVSGAAVHSTPIVSGEVYSFYYIALESISVESDKKILTTSNSSSSVRMIVDSASSYTYLPHEMYDSLVANLMKLIPSEPVLDAEVQLCYKSDVRMPKIVMHFAGAKVTLSDLNSFVKTTYDDQDVVCLAFQVSDDQPVYGNIQQANFLISYDLKGKNLYFRKADCTKY